jgi:hypothetical protein
MGGGSWDPDLYSGYSKSKGYTNSDGSVNKNLGVHDVFKSTNLNQALDPHHFGQSGVRESCDSDEHPESNPIILGLDVTGSMGVVAQMIAQQGLPNLMKKIYEVQPVPHPQVLFMGIDDLEANGHIQVSQFESDIRIAKQLEELWIEGMGGGNSYESYSMAWLIAAHHTKIDSFLKRKKKGYLFTIGDELPTPELYKEDVHRILGYTPQYSLTGKALLEAARKQWRVFHITCMEGSWAGSHKPKVKEGWNNVLGDRAIFLDRYEKIAETILATIQIAEGHDKEKLFKLLDPDTAAVISAATKNVKRIVEV